MFYFYVQIVLNSATLIVYQSSALIRPVSVVYLLFYFYY